MTTYPLAVKPMMLDSTTTTPMPNSATSADQALPCHHVAPPRMLVALRVKRPRARRDLRDAAVGASASAATSLLLWRSSTHARHLDEHQCVLGAWRVARAALAALTWRSTARSSLQPATAGVAHRQCRRRCGGCSSSLTTRRGAARAGAAAACAGSVLRAPPPGGASRQSRRVYTRRR